MLPIAGSEHPEATSIRGDICCVLAIGSSLLCCVPGCDQQSDGAAAAFSIPRWMLCSYRNFITEHLGLIGDLGSPLPRKSAVPGHWSFVSAAVRQTARGLGDDGRMARLDQFIFPGARSATSSMQYVKRWQASCTYSMNGVGCDWQGHGYQKLQPMIDRE